MYMGPVTDTRTEHIPYGMEHVYLSVTAITHITPPNSFTNGGRAKCVMCAKSRAHFRFGWLPQSVLSTYSRASVLERLSLALIYSYLTCSSARLSVFVCLPVKYDPMGPPCTATRKYVITSLAVGNSRTFSRTA